MHTTKFEAICKFMRPKLAFVTLISNIKVLSNLSLGQDFYLYNFEIFRDKNYYMQLNYPTF